ncbi:HAD-IA family hydrolase [Granulicella mallensis]|uniref:Sugar-phosphatase n=1 Tax=Granulicella mallensis TaxID=940614 RepID=A0A7W7ZR95_9BACT|nr:HAD-IA family hydrolase [Granulicella mallensis]MBB5064334.1 sugar-phosphatase [Granulicella mallensis]
MSHQVSTEAAALLFDNDGVIVSSIASVNRCWKIWAAHYGVPNADKVEIAHGTRAVEIMKNLAPDVDPVEGLKLIEDMEIADVADVEVLPGVRALLTSLPANRWAIVSSATHRLLVARLQAAKLPEPEWIVSADRVVNGKPHPEPYLLGAKLIQVAPEDCIVVEDAPSGVSAGKAAGCRVLGVLGTHNAEELRAASVDWVVASLEHVRAESVADGLKITFDTV